MMFFWFLLPALIFFALLSRDRGASASSNPSGDPSETILRTRFARGEISRAEYLHMRETLRVPPEHNGE